MTLTVIVFRRTHLIETGSPDFCGEINTIYTQIERTGQYGDFNTSLINRAMEQLIKWTGVISHLRWLYLIFDAHRDQRKRPNKRAQR